MTIVFFFNYLDYYCLKRFHQEKICKHVYQLFPNVVSCNRFVELEREVALPLAIFIKKVLLGKCTGISFVDSTPLCIFYTQRILIHKTFKGIVQKVKCSMEWFFEFKQHLICIEKVVIIFMIALGDVDNRQPFEYKSFVEFVYVKLFVNNEYISKNHIYSPVQRLVESQNRTILNQSKKTLRRANKYITLLQRLSTLALSLASA